MSKGVCLLYFMFKHYLNTYFLQRKPELVIQYLRFPWVYREAILSLWPPLHCRDLNCCMNLIKRVTKPFSNNDCRYVAYFQLQLKIILWVTWYIIPDHKSIHTVLIEWSYLYQRVYSIYCSKSVTLGNQFAHIDISGTEK